jgi:hypothetical protein
MVARGAGFLHTRAALGEEAGQQQSGLDLRARHVEHVLAAGQPASTVNGDRRAPVTRPDIRAHAPQRLSHPLHGSPHEGRIADEHGVERLAGEDAGQQSHRGAGIAEVERPGRRAQSAHADATHQEMPGTGALAAHAHCRQCCKRRDAIAAFEKAVNLGRPLRNRPEHCGTMRDRLVAGHANLAGDGDRWRYDIAARNRAHAVAAIAIAMAASSRSTCSTVPVEMRR